MDVVLIEDLAVLRQGLKALLETELGARVVSDVDTAEAGLRYLDGGSCDLVIVDLSLPGRDGFWAVRQIKARRPETRVLVLSMHGDGQIVARCLRAGADAYVPKTAPHEELLETIRTLCHGGSSLPQGADPGTGGPAIQDLPPVSETEREVLRLLARGVEAQELSPLLGIPPEALQAVLASLQERLGCADLHGLRSLGLRLGS